MTEPTSSAAAWEYDECPKCGCPHGCAEGLLADIPRWCRAPWARGFILGNAVMAPVFIILRALHRV